MGSPTNRRVTRSAAGVALVAATLMAISGCTTLGSGDSSGASRVPIPDVEIKGASADSLNTAVKDAMKASGASGAIVAVWVPWAGAWDRAIGTTTAGGKEPVSADMHFRAGQVTRAMTCDVLYGMAQSGKVKLDDTVTKYVSTVPQLQDVTLKQLCDQTSGLSMSMPRMNSRVMATPERIWTEREFAAPGIIERARPGIQAADSDSGYILLGQALESAAGTNLASLFDTYVFSPRGLSATAIPSDDPAPAGDPVLNGLYSATGDRKAGCVAPIDFTVLSPSFAAADSAVTTTIADLARYGQALALDSRDASGKPKARWATPIPLVGGKVDYAGGTILAGELIGQQGSMPGYLSAVYADPTTGLTVAVVLNNSAAKATLAGDLARELAAIATKVPASGGEKRPQIGLTWTAEQAHKDVAAGAVCAG